MTFFVPLETTAPLPTHPPFLRPGANNQLETTINAIAKAKRIIVLCGAGISVQAGIPDFRSSEGLFQSLKRENNQLSSGKDLFDASVFNSPQTTSLFFQMVSQLAVLSSKAQPTPFHKSLKSLDDSSRLLRVYTQNIDAIEEKTGLSFGVQGGSDSRCIPLHGTIQTMHCQICNHNFPLDDYLSELQAGTPPDCPECISIQQTRELVGKRTRGVGKLRPSVVLYNEAHKDGERVGDIVSRDLATKRPDLLLVVGTSLRVPGTKRMVREFAKAAKAAGGSSVYVNLDFPVPTREWEGVFDTWIQGDAQVFARLLQEKLDKVKVKRKQQTNESPKKKMKLVLKIPIPRTPPRHASTIGRPPPTPDPTPPRRQSVPREQSISDEEDADPPWSPPPSPCSYFYPNLNPVSFQTSCIRTTAR